MPDLRAYLKQELEHDQVNAEFAIKVAQISVVRLKATLKKLSKIKNIDDLRVRVRVRIVSLWEKEGEKSVTVTGKGIRSAVQKAVAKFKRINNNRSDVQGTFTVKIFLPPSKKMAVSLPEIFWREYTT